MRLPDPGNSEKDRDSRRKARLRKWEAQLRAMTSTELADHKWKLMQPWLDAQTEEARKRLLERARKLAKRPGAKSLAELKDVLVRHPAGREVKIGVIGRIGTGGTKPAGSTASRALN